MYHNTPDNDQRGTQENGESSMGERGESMNAMITSDSTSAAMNSQLTTIREIKPHMQPRRNHKRDGHNDDDNSTKPPSKEYDQ